MALHAHLVASLDEVVPQLTDQLSQPTNDLFTHELIVVPGAGVQQWITERLASTLGASAGSRDGIVANIDTVFPGALGSRLLGGWERDDPWSVARLTHTLVDLIAERPELVPEGRRRDGPVSAARRTADLFDRYHFHRPDMILRWAVGVPSLQNVGGDREPPLPDWAHWQFELWRAAHARIGKASPPERTREAIARLHDGQQLERLPRRVFIVGVTGLAPLHLEALTALAQHTDIFAWLAHPSPGLLHATRPTLGELAPLRIPLAQHPAAHAAQLPQLSSWTRPSQSMQVLLAGAKISPTLPPRDVAPGGEATLLHRVQRALRLDEAPHLNSTSPSARIADGSLRLHRAHGLARQCEVLREALLHTLRELPDLDPRDIVIIAPNIAEVAPHLEGVFPARKPDAPPDPLALPLRVADRSLAKANEVAGLLDQLLALPESRAGLRELRALCSVSALRRALAVDEATIELWFGWAESLRVRWGLTADHRAAFGLPNTLDVHTWQHVLQRLLAGAVLDPTDDAGIRTVVPARGVEVGELPAIATLARLLALLTSFVDASRRPRPVVEWCDLLLELLGVLSKMPRNQDEPRARVLRLVTALRAEASGSSTPVDFAELRCLLSPVLAGDPPHVNLRSGKITATSLVPLRGVPFRVVCLVGLDDGAFGAGDGDGEDLLREQPLVGDPDPRGEQRQAFLEALLQAKDRVILTCTGFDPRSNEKVEPITPVSALLDLVNAVGGDVDRVVVDHPRHASDPRCFTSGALIPDVPFGHFDAQRHASQYLLSAVQTDDEDDDDLPRVSVALRGDIPVADLILALTSPTDLYVKRTLGIYVFEGDGDAPPTLPTAATRREFTLAAQSLLTRRQHLSADSTDAMIADQHRVWRAAMARTGWLPPLGLADTELDDAEALAAEVLRQCGAKQIPLDPGRTVEVRLPLADGRHVTATIPGVFDAGPYRHISVSAKRNDTAQKLWQLVLTWLLVLHAGDTSIASFYIGQNDGSGKKRSASFARRAAVLDGVSLEKLRIGLEALVALHDEARGAARPLFGEVADAVVKGDDAAARRAFSDHTNRQQSFTSESRLFGTSPDFDVIFGNSDERAFIESWHDLKTAYITIENDRAISRPRSKKGAAS